MKRLAITSAILCGVTLAGGFAFRAVGQPGAVPLPASRRDAVQEAQAPARPVQQRVEQLKTEHDLAIATSAKDPAPITRDLQKQPNQGQTLGFDFGRDGNGSARPMQPFEEIMTKESRAKADVMAAQKSYLAGRFNMRPRLDPKATMSRGKPLAVGPTAILPEGMRWEDFASMTPAEIREKGAFPYTALPHPLQTNGGQVFPQMQVQMFPRLQRFDVDFDLPEEFLPEFPPAIFLNNRPELGDVSQGEVVTINNYYRLFKGLLTPVQLDGLRMLVTPFPQEEFNPTDDRKTLEPSLGVTCFDCHVNGHTTAQFHLNPDTRPQERRMRLDTTSLRGVFNQQIHGSKRSLRSIEDFTEFEQRTAYFNGDQSHAAKKGMNIIDRVLVSNMAQMQNMLDFPPAPKLDVATGRLNPDKASDAELRGEAIFFGKGKCASCHSGAFYLDDKMHDLHLERFMYDEPGDGPIKTFTLRGIKDSPPYLHDGRCLTLEDTVEFFNIVLELKLTKDEKVDLVAFMRAL
ncbi:hypothetical protein ETAA8_02680 [Anatilimnocola aggregata]|uniref:Cytochrome c domain-containing protein n=1 Tax=Anatilimnocola aggregata TaxID=2528021 RepID=A0A517Y4Q0_9BACT|nr:cytochrome B6 [Anatilimnocola aggregata]QDU25205.1 hypothetical protein ETAA8_02680 [Anatilimnocola aggregata]